MNRPRTQAQCSQKCPGCGEGIKEGDDIFLIEEEWCCESCKEEDEL